MKYVTIDDVIRLHKKLISKFGGSYGIREVNLLNSSISSVFQTYDGVELYPSDLDKIIQVSYSLIENHCFIDGNKRIGTMVLLYLLKINCIDHSINNYDLIDIGLKVASGEMNKEYYKKYIESKLK